MCGDLVGLLEPVGDGRFYLVTVDNSDLMAELNGRCLHDLPYMPIFQSPAKEEPDLEKRLLWADEEVTRFAREHDRAMRGVDSLITELGRCFA